MKETTLLALTFGILSAMTTTFSIFNLHVNPALSNVLGLVAALCMVPAFYLVRDDLLPGPSDD